MVVFLPVNYFILKYFWKGSASFVLSTGQVKKMSPFTATHWEHQSKSQLSAITQSYCSKPMQDKVHTFGDEAPNQPDLDVMVLGSGAGLLLWRT